MELAGNEKKIQALFRELKVADERLAPEFMSVWNRAQATSPGSSRIFKISLAVAAALFVITLSSLVLWSRNGQRSEQVNPEITSGWTKPAPAAKPGPTQLVVAQPPVRIKSNRWDRKLAPRRHADLSARNATISEAVSISSWQSPTATLMQSPADGVLTSLPQLDRAVNNLKTFLPNTPQ